MSETGKEKFINILQDYILILQDIIARQDGCSDFWDMKYDDMLSNNFYPTVQECIRNLEHTLNLEEKTNVYTDDMWFVLMLREHISAYKSYFNVE